MPSFQRTALWLIIFSYAPYVYKPLLVSGLLSSGHPWVRSVITGVVTAEPPGSTTDWAPPGRSRHVSRFPGPKCHCACVCVCVCPRQPLCFLSAMHGKWKTLCRDILWSRGSPCRWWVTGLTCITSAFLQRCVSAQRSLKNTNTYFLFIYLCLPLSPMTCSSPWLWCWNDPCVLEHKFWIFKMLMMSQQSRSS